MPLGWPLHLMLSSTKQLSGCPKELWLLYLLKFLESYAYFSMSINFPIFLTDEFGIDDTTAGFIYGTWGVLISVFGMLAGGMIDYLGVKNSLVVGAAVSAIGRFMFALAGSRGMIFASTFFVMPIGLALGIPVMVIAVKRYTEQRVRTYAFGLFYSFMNVAALLAGPITDMFRYAMPDGIKTSSGVLTPLRMVFLTGGLASVAMFVVALVLFREVNMDERGRVKEFTPRRENTRALLRKTMKDRRFWRLVVFALLLVGVRLVFRHMDATFPKYLKRTLGENVPYGTLYGINPFMCIFLVPLVSAHTTHIHPWRLILRGSFVAGASPFWLTLGASYATAVLFVVTLSLGEAFYSPAVYVYTMMLAPEGQEGLYTGLANIPMFTAKFFAGGMSGFLLSDYCPKGGPADRCWVVWLVVGIISFASPILMAIFRKFIQPESTDNYSATAAGDSLLAAAADEDEEAAGLQLHDLSAGKPAIEEDALGTDAVDVDLGDD
eukprot:PLAT4379.5.p1 GENE.PLAT4379.5~~PLAT4379.5.p1  ORF type:complete len:493 (+),score=182.85 PLAT4379.5:65-1543(+)